MEFLNDITNGSPATQYAITLWKNLVLFLSMLNILKGQFSYITQCRSSECKFSHIKTIYKDFTSDLSLIIIQFPTILFVKNNIHV